ncbi:transducin beta-like protein 2 isoform X2 [Diabrotica virgifera virgifera]|uniref:Transducin beta-like protein 2 n=2 Tax=Diabrotica virgifera virgifera TaxID=50390 RepID=A0ABM5KE72_DIAVI|nr:transducin beta-like protein 2 isoform X2 [Diabrotica virgifera virgifera]
MESVISDFLTSTVFVFSLLIGASGLLILYFIKTFKQEAVIEKTKNEKSTVYSEKKKDLPQAGKRKKKTVENRWTGKHDKHSYSNPWLLVSLKGHTGNILDMDFSSNGKYMTSCDDAGAVFLWDTKDFSSKDRKSLRVNIEFDHATHVKWSPDSKAFIINKYNENAVEVYKVEKKKDGFLTASKAFTFPKHHETDIVGMGIASNGKFIITCSNKTDLVVWDLKGQKMAVLDTYLMNNTCAKISPCGKFIVVSGFSPEAKVWEVFFNKSGEFQEVKPIKELTLGGHTSGVYDVGFDVDSSHMATVSKDGSWHLYDTKVSYKQGENARLLKSGQYEKSGNYALIALSPNAEVVAIATANDVALYSTWTTELDHKIENIYEGNITAIMFDSTGKFLLTAGDKQIRVFHNVTGYKCGIVTAKEKLKEHVTSATKERLEKLIKENQAFLDNIVDK